jgi:hypothetical protein
MRALTYFGVRKLIRQYHFNIASSDIRLEHFPPKMWQLKQKEDSQMGKAILMFVVLCFAFGCVSQPLKIPTLQNKAPEKDYQVVGVGEGGALGIMLFNLIPIGQNSRFERAYEEAVKSKGGDRIIDPEIKETWFWGLILNGYITEISGTVVKDIK